MYVSIKTFLRFHSWYEFHVFDVFKKNFERFCLNLVNYMVRSAMQQQAYESQINYSVAELKQHFIS